LYSVLVRSTTNHLRVQVWHIGSCPTDPFVPQPVTLIPMFDPKSDKAEGFRVLSREQSPTPQQTTWDVLRTGRDHWVGLSN